MFQCLSCSQSCSLPSGDPACPSCGGIVRLPDPGPFDDSQIDRGNHSIWRYRHTFPAALAALSLGEGSTPLVEICLQNTAVFFKLEHLNPTGSFKDRGTSLLVSLLQSHGIQTAVEDSSGNAGASLAAYCALANIRARVFVPETTSAAKTKQITAYGARIVQVAGPRSRAEEAARSASSAAVSYASHVFNPIGIAGIATTAFEIWEEMVAIPEAILVPAGQGTQLLGLRRGFRALVQGGLISRMPKLIGVQAERCAPFWSAAGGSRFSPASGQLDTIAEGIRVEQPARIREVVAALEESQGHIETVSEQEIEDGAQQLASRGFLVEFTSAVVWAALQRLLARRSYKSIGVILTGNGLKTLVS